MERLEVAYSAVCYFKGLEFCVELLKNNKNEYINFINPFTGEEFISAIKFINSLKNRLDKKDYFGLLLKILSLTNTKKLNKLIKKNNKINLEKEE